MKRVDLTGKTFGKWTVLKRLGSLKSYGDIFWECRCECGKISKVRSYHLTKGYSRRCVSCGHLPRPYKSELAEQNWKVIVRCAKKRGIRVLLTREEAYRVFLTQKKKCALTGLDICFPTCGNDRRNNKWTASLDRLDSNKPYTRDNIQWVHKHVNRMKNVFSQDYFLSICRMVVEHKGLK